MKRKMISWLLVAALTLGSNSMAFAADVELFSSGDDSEVVFVSEPEMPELQDVAMLAVDGTDVEEIELASGYTGFLDDGIPAGVDFDKISQGLEFVINFNDGKTPETVRINETTSSGYSLSYQKLEETDDYKFYLAECGQDGPSVTIPAGSKTIWDVGAKNITEGTFVSYSEFEKLYGGKFYVACFTPERTGTYHLEQHGFTSVDIVNVTTGLNYGDFFSNDYELTENNTYAFIMKRDFPDETDEICMMEQKEIAKVEIIDSSAIPSKWLSVIMPEIDAVAERIKLRVTFTNDLTEDLSLSKAAQKYNMESWFLEETNPQTLCIGVYGENTELYDTLSVEIVDSVDALGVDLPILEKEMDYYENPETLYPYANSYLGIYTPEKLSWVESVGAVGCSCYETDTLTEGVLGEMEAGTSYLLQITFGEPTEEERLIIHEYPAESSLPELNGVGTINVPIERVTDDAGDVTDNTAEFIFIPTEPGVYNFSIPESAMTENTGIRIDDGESSEWWGLAPWFGVQLEGEFIYHVTLNTMTDGLAEVPVTVTKKNPIVKVEIADGGDKVQTSWVYGTTRWNWGLECLKFKVTFEDDTEQTVSFGSDFTNGNDVYYITNKLIDWPDNYDDLEHEDKFVPGEYIVGFLVGGMDGVSLEMPTFEMTVMEPEVIVDVDVPIIDASPEIPAQETTIGFSYEGEEAAKTNFDEIITDYVSEEKPDPVKIDPAGDLADETAVKAAMSSAEKVITKVNVNLVPTIDPDTKQAVKEAVAPVAAGEVESQSDITIEVQTVNNTETTTIGSIHELPKESALEFTVNLTEEQMAKKIYAVCQHTEESGNESYTMIPEEDTTQDGAVFTFKANKFSNYFIVSSENVTVTYDKTRAGGTETAEVVYKGFAENKEVSLNSYNFLGWFEDNVCTKPWEFETPVTRNMTLYAGWEYVPPVTTPTPEPPTPTPEPPTPTYYAVNFDSQGGSAVASVYYTYGRKIAVPEAPTRADYIFEGWYKEASCINAWDFENDYVKSSMTLYAKWKEVEKPPVKVTEISAQVSITSVKLTWNHVENADGYLIKGRTRGEEEFTWETTVEATADILSYKQSGLDSGIIREYVVIPYRMIDGEKVYGEASEVFSAATCPTRPSLKEVISKKGYVKAIVNKASVGADGYEYAYSEKTTEWTSDEDYTILGRSAKSYYINKKVATGIYVARVRPFKMLDGKRIYGNWSAQKWFEVPSGTIAAPEILSAKVKGNTVTVTLKNVKGAKGYDAVLGMTRNPIKPTPYKYVVKNQKTTVIVFKNVKKGTYYVGSHAYQTVKNKKIFSKWSNQKKVVVK